MTYKESLNYIKENSKNKIIPGLENMEKLCSLLGDPERKIKTIHIAGTNGKGSVGAFIEEGLIKNGYNVGRYTSPAVLNYRDILTYNKKRISEEEFASVTSEVKSILENSDCKPTVFELETAIAFYWLSKKNCDFAIIETGMGGRLDATNVTDKILAVITPVSVDHTKFLGNTIEEIASEKAGIIKDTAVSAQQEPSVKEVLRAKSNDITFASTPENIIYSNDKTTFDYKSYKNVEITMLGKFQAENACLAIEVFEKLNKMGYNITNIENSLINAQWHCRFEKISSDPLIIIDGAHNPHGVKALKENTELYFKNRDVVFITGVLKDKDYSKMAEIIAPLAKRIFTIESDSPRALSAEDYAKAISRYNKNVTACKSIKEAVNSALEYDNILVFGSLSFMGEIYNCFNETMERYNRIKEHSLFNEIINIINDKEKTRIFCKHGTDHCLDVARIAYILSLENNLNIKKDIIYATALLHDTGRAFEDDDHDKKSAEISEEILADCGYSQSEIQEIISAILNHRKDTSKLKNLSDIICKADKLSRQCYSCKAQKECYWQEERRNKNIKY